MTEHFPDVSRIVCVRYAKRSVRKWLQDNKLVVIPHQQVHVCKTFKEMVDCHTAGQNEAARRTLGCESTQFKQYFQKH